MPEDDFLQQFAKLIRELLEEQRGEGESVKELLTAHLGPDAGDLPVLTEELDGWELPTCNSRSRRRSVSADAAPGSSDSPAGRCTTTASASAI